MSWKPISEATLWDDINDAYDRMSPAQMKVWEIIKVLPEKWQEKTYGDLGGGFWVVAVIGSSVVWYNDIEDGYNQSQYKKYGVIDEYWCNQSRLESAVQDVINMLGDGCDAAGRSGPPQPIA